MILSFIVAIVLINFVSEIKASSVDLVDYEILQVNLLGSSNNALIRRRYHFPLNVSLDSGSNSIVLKNLPPSLQDDSVRFVNVGGLSIITSQIKKIVENDRTKYNELVALLKSQIEGVTRKINSLLDNQNAVLFQIDAMKQFVNTHATRKDNIATLSEFSNMLENQSHQHSLLSEKLSHLDELLSHEKRELESLKEKLSLLIESSTYSDPTTGKLLHFTSLEKVTKNVELQVQCVDCKVQEVVVEYNAGPVSRQFDYELSFNKNSARSKKQLNLDVTMFTAISQRTGEDWIMAPISISSSEPRHFAPLDFPLAQTVDFIQFREGYGGRGVGGRGGTLAFAKMDVNAISNAPSIELETGSATPSFFVASNTVTRDVPTTSVNPSFLFQLPFSMNVSSSSISSENSYRSFLSSTSLAVQSLTLGIPSRGLNGHWMIAGRLDVNAPFPLQGHSNCEVMVDEAKIGKLSLPQTVYPGQSFQLLLGKNPQVHVNSWEVPILKSKTQDEDSLLSFLSSEKKKKYKLSTKEFRLEMKNEMSQSSTDSTLGVMLENYPVATDSDIRVELLSPSPASLMSLSTLENQCLHLEKVVKAQGWKGPAEQITSVCQPLTSDDDVLRVIVSILDMESFRNSLNPTSPPSMFQNLVTLNSSSSHNLWWIKWLTPGERVQTSIKYRTLWPEEKEVQIH